MTKLVSNWDLTSKHLTSVSMLSKAFTALVRCQSCGFEKKKLIMRKRTPHHVKTWLTSSGHLVRSRYILSRMICLVVFTLWPQQKNKCQYHPGNSALSSYSLTKLSVTFTDSLYKLQHYLHIFPFFPIMQSCLTVFDLLICSSVFIKGIWYSNGKEYSLPLEYSFFFPVLGSVQWPGLKR